MTSASSLGLSSSITRPCATPTHGSQLRSPRGSGPLGPSVLQGPGPSKALAATLRPSRRPRRGMSRRLLRADAMAGPGTSRWLQRSGRWAQAASYGGWDRRGEGGHHGYDGGWWTDVQSASSTSAWTWDAWAAEWHGDGLRPQGEMMADIQSQAGHPPLEAQEVAADGKGLFRKGRHRHSTDGSVTAVATVARHVVVCDPPRHRRRRAKYSAVPGGVDVAGRAVV